MEVNSLITRAYNSCITVLFAGVGGTGSLLLHQMARMAVALREARGIELYVIVLDPDIVTMSNRGRQCYTEYDLGRYKANVIVERINRSYGLRWGSAASPFPVPGDDSQPMRNIVITCIDNIAGRKATEVVLKARAIWEKQDDDHAKRFAYWLDCGNTYDSGNVIITDLSILPPLSVYLKGMKQKKQKATCSLATAMGRQHLMVNSWAANIAGTILWNLIYYHKLEIHAAFYNIETMQTRTIKTSKYAKDNANDNKVDDLPRTG